MVEHSTPSNRGNELQQLSRAGLVLASICAGWIMWAWFGGVEAAILAWTFPGQGIPDTVILLGVFSYGLTGALLGLTVGLLLAFLAPRAWRARIGVPLLGALLFALWFAGVLGAGITFRNMPRALNLASVGVAGSFVLASIPLAWGWLVALRRLRSRLADRHWRALVVTGALLPLLIGMVPAVTTSLEDEGTGVQSVPWLPDPVVAVTRADGAATDAEYATTSRPNILFILVDTLRSDHLGTYGYPLATSPTIDSLATTGLQCNRVNAASSWTRPSVATIFSGLYPSTHGLTNYYTGFPAEALLLPEMLKSRGYHTAVFSNNGHVSQIYGFAQGVDQMNSTASSTYQFLSLGMISYRFGMRLGFKPALATLSICSTTERLLMPGAANDGSGADLNRYFLDWLDRAPAEPFFAYLHYFEPHAPYTPPSPWDMECDAVEIPSYSAMPPADRDMYAPYEAGTDLPGERSDYLRRRYDAEIRYQDALIGEVLGAVRDQGLADNTLVLFTSDHGEEFFDHGHWGHGKSLFHEVTRVPLIASLPGRLAAGSHYDELVEHVDLVPTILGLAGLRLDPAIIEGVDLAATWTAAAGGAAIAPAPQAPNGLAMTELSQNGFDAVAVEDQDYLYIALEKRGDQRELLYDLRADPACVHDVSDAADDMVQVYRAQLERKRGDLLVSRAQIAPVMGEETLERLKALGYIE